MSGNILLSFEDSYTAKYRQYSHKKPEYFRLNELKDTLPKLKLNLQKQISEYVENELVPIIKQIRIDSRMDAVQHFSLDVFRENDSFIKVATYLIKDRNLLNYYIDILKRNNVWFEDESKNDQTTVKNAQSGAKQIGKKETKPSVQSSYNLLGLSDINSPVAISKPTERKNKTTFETRKITESMPFDKPEIKTVKPTQQEIDFDKDHGKLETTSVLPEIRKRLTRPRTIKASSSFWENLGKKRIDIGKRGELLVLNDERKRILREEGKEYLPYLEHSSVVQADGLGYDIE